MKKTVCIYKIPTQRKSFVFVQFYYLKKIFSREFNFVDMGIIDFRGDLDFRGEFGLNPC